MIPLKDYIVTRNAMSLADLPCEVISMIARTIYDPLTITQKDRLSKSHTLRTKLTFHLSLGHILHCRYGSGSTEQS